MKLFVITSLLLFTACATPEYQKAEADGWHRAGYSDVKITPTVYRVTYLDPKPDQAYAKFLIRASELAKQNGYEFFTVRDSGDTNTHDGSLYMGAGYAANFGIGKYEATITLSHQQLKESFVAKEILDANNDKMEKAAKAEADRKAAAAKAATISYDGPSYGM